MKKLSPLDGLYFLRYLLPTPVCVSWEVSVRFSWCCVTIVRGVVPDVHVYRLDPCSYILLYCIVHNVCQCAYLLHDISDILWINATRVSS